MKELEVDWSKRNEPAMRDRLVAQYFDFAIAMARRKLKKLPTSVDPHGIESAALDGRMSCRGDESKRSCRSVRQGV